ncbi:MAG: hypothetical protein ACO31I_18440 [Prochlorotrichaceae cyanobacterium]|jgi:WD40 repeat protein
MNLYSVVEEIKDSSGKISIWDFKNDDRVFPEIDYQDDVYALVFSPNNSELLAISDAQGLKVFNIESGDKEIKITDQLVRNMIFARNGNAIIGFAESSPTLWDLKGKIIKSYNNIYGNNTSNLSLTQNDQLLLLDNAIQASGGIFSKDPSWYFWRLENLYMDDNGKTLKGFSEDELVTVDLSLKGLLQKGCELAQGFLASNPNLKESDRKICDDV